MGRFCLVCTCYGLFVPNTSHAMSKINRPMSRGKKLLAAMSRSPQIVCCARTFINWLPITRVYGGASLPTGFAARARCGFELPLRDPADVQTTWVVFCASDYFVPDDCKTVLDLGANIGAFTLYAACCRKAQHVYAFEPVAGTFDILQQNILANRVANVTLFHKGIAGQSGTRKMHLGVTSQHSSMIYRGSSKYESGVTEEVEVVSLEQLLDDLAVDQVDMAKMDCEGGEVEVILAASDDTLRRIKHLSIEYHFPANISNEAEFFGRLARAGFKCRRKSRAGKLAQFVRV